MNSSTTAARKEAILSLLNSACDRGDAIALWREPHQSMKHVIMSHELQSLDEVELQELPSGFLIAPFSPEAKKHFIKSDWHYVWDGDNLTPGVTNTTDYPIAKGRESSGHPNFHHRQPSALAKHDFRALVNHAIEKIGWGEMEKVVPSRCKDIVLPENFDALKSFETLCHRYPHALVSLHSSPALGTWMGATPELLVSVDEQMIFRTVALAGTLPFQESMNLKEVAWTQKEIEEQAMVTRYIISCFKKIRLREYEEHGPKTIVAGNLLHLKTEYSVDMTAVNFPSLGSVMLKLLHPTSAVCGMPLQPALKFLQDNEGYDRQLYSGYLGPVNLEGNTRLFVNLRCMQLFQNSARLFAGAGVTIDSVAGNELKETEMKMDTLLTIIQSAS